MTAEERRELARARMSAVSLAASAMAAGRFEPTPETLDATAHLAAAATFDLDLEPLVTA